VRSMTGYGRGEADCQGVKLSVELSTVNRKQSEIAINLPRDLTELEARIRQAINARISRGRTNVLVAHHASADGTRRLALDVELARSYHDAMRALQKKLGAPGQITIDTILQEICQLHPAVLKKFRKALTERIEKTGLPISKDDERLAKEIFLFADRSDISEELTRVESHLAQFAHHLRKEEPVGRALEFIVQEIFREFNTLGAKANDADIAQRVVACKTELEKIREQVQNLE